MAASRGASSPAAPALDEFRHFCHGLTQCNLTCHPCPKRFPPYSPAWLAAPRTWVRAAVLQLERLAGATNPARLPEPPVSYQLQGKWTHMLAFRGNFASKSRRYSTTMGRLRFARRRFERARAFSPNGVVDIATLEQDLAQDQTTLVINDWRFVGTGWITEGDGVLAAEASAVARKHANAKRSARSCAASGTTGTSDTAA